jgi:hypothetical protein
MRAITVDDLKPLLDQFDGPGRVLSCYADLAAAGTAGQRAETGRCRRKVIDPE